MNEKIQRFIEENSQDWSCDGSAKIQLEKLKKILQGESRVITCNEEDCAVYTQSGPMYGGHDGKRYTLDVDAFSKDIASYLADWTLPTIEGHSVDLWLLK